MSIRAEVLSIEAYRRSVAVRDLTDPGQGPHSLQHLVEAATSALTRAWGAELIVRRANPIVPIEDNYDRLHYPPDGAARDARYTRYVSERLVLRTQTSAMIPPALADLARDSSHPSDALLACPGLVYRRDCIDRLHTGEPHQLDLWRVRRGAPLGRGDLLAMIDIVLAAVVPGISHRVVDAEHPYTTGGLQIDVRAGDEWTEVGECGLALPALLVDAGLPVAGESSYTGLAMGLGLDRLLMIRKGVSDIRLLRASDPRIASQMLDLSPYQPVSNQPAVRRDLSLAVDVSTTGEDLGDRVREALGDDARLIEHLEVAGETGYDALPPQAIARMGMRPSHKNVLLRLILRDLDHTLTHGQANHLRDRVYAAVHEGARSEWT